MNQTCKVCGEPAAGFHFGAFTCEGCKSFFGRSFNNVTAISDCKNNGECVINKKNRTACKACRLRKCLMVGMSKSGSRYGRRSNWFKIHCLLQEQQEKQQLDGNQAMHSTPPYPFSLSSTGYGLQKSKEDEYKTVSTPSTSPASSQISDTTISSIDLLSKFRASAGNDVPLLFDQKHPLMGHNPAPMKMPKDFFLPMAFPGMPFPLPPTNLAQLFLSGFGANVSPSNPMAHHFQDAYKGAMKHNTDLHHRKQQFVESNLSAAPFMGLDPILLQKQMQEEHHRLLNSPPASVSPNSPPQSCETKPAPNDDLNPPSPLTQRRDSVGPVIVAEEDEEILVEPSKKRPKLLSNSGGGNSEESSNIATGAPRKISLGDEPLDLSLTKPDHDESRQCLTVAAAASPRHVPTLSQVNRPEKYKGTDCPPKWIGQTGEAAAATATEDEQAGDDDVQVDMDDQKQTAFFDYLKQTFIRENQFLKIKNNEIYSF